MLTSRKKKSAIESVSIHKTDTGSTPVQIAILSKRIDELVGHLKTHRKDHHSRRGLLLMVGKRRTLLSYLMKKDERMYKSLIKKLDLKK